MTDPKELRIRETHGEFYGNWKAPLLVRLFRCLKAPWDLLVLNFCCYSFTIALTLLYSLHYRRKMSHNNGIAAKGKLKIVDSPEFPDHDFFIAGREFDCRIRHASAAYMDDAMLLVRSMSIKFSPNRVESPFDLEMNAGRSLFWSVATFLSFAFNKKQKNGTQYLGYYMKHPAGQRAGIESACNQPSSYSKQQYYSQTPTLFIGTDGVTRYVKYRCQPLEGDIEPMHNSQLEVGEFMGDQRCEPNTTKHRNYLKEEYRSRLSDGPIKYLLQLQIREPREDDTPLMFNSNYHWNEERYPFVDLAEITIDEALSYEEGNLMYFSHNHCPPSLDIIPARSIHDFNSLNHMRKRVDLAKKVRLRAYRWFGMPNAVPDEGPRNVDEITCENTGVTRDF